MDIKKCPALNSRCRNCDKIGHWDKKCRSKKIHCIDKEDENPAFLDKVHDTTADKDFTAKVMIQELNSEIDFIIDTGADVCISDNCIPINCRNKIVKSTKSILGADGRNLSVKGCFIANLRYKQCKVKAKVYIIQGLKQNLLGKPEIRELDLVSKVNITKVDNKFPSDICSNYPKLFNGIGQFKNELEIQLKEGAVPFFQSVPRTVAISLLPKLKSELDKLMKLGIIVPVDFPTEWCSPIVVVPKKNNNDIRLCCNYTKLNNSVKRANFPILKIDTSLAHLKGSKIFTKLDAQAGFHQITLHKNSQPLTTFITPFGR